MINNIEEIKRNNAIEKANERWNSVHSHYERDQIKYDDWLDSFKTIIQNCSTPIIDLGCGSGNDTLYLIERGKQVIPCDYSQNAIQNIKKNFPEVTRVECFDMTKGLPFEDNFTDIVICDLSLHYFTKDKTLEILEEIKRVLKPNGILLFRVNSVRDVNHGAGEGTEIELHLYETEDGRHKRFFDKDDFKVFFLNWEELYLNEETMGRYDLEKVLWKGAFRVKK
jgi:SAM-dependent methyltransferase